MYITRFIHYLILVTSRIKIRVVPQNSRMLNLAPIGGVAPARVFGWSESRGVSLTGASAPSCGIHPLLLELSQDVRHTEGSSRSKEQPETHSQAYY